MSACKFGEEIDKIVNSDSVFIYGAGDVAKEVAYCLMQEPFEKTINGFIISDKPEKCESIFDIPVISYYGISPQSLILVAVLEKYRDEILHTLEKNGLNNYLVVTYESDLWCEIRKEWFAILCRNNNSGIDLLEKKLKYVPQLSKKEKKLKVYVAKSPFDRRLKESVTNKKWETDIQVGAVYSDNRISRITDADGDNISVKNKRYNEITALYWLWKHADDDYIGLSHYRRRFDLSGDDVSGICNSEIDAIITAPIINVPSVKYMYGKNHSANDWKVFGEAIETITPDYLQDFHAVENGIIYVPYNMVIFRQRWLKAYCEWAFPIFEHIERNTPGRDDDVYQRRNIGFLSERVMTVFLKHHLAEMNIAIADKMFFE